MIRTIFIFLFAAFLAPIVCLSNHAALASTSPSTPSIPTASASPNPPAASTPSTQPFVIPKDEPFVYSPPNPKKIRDIQNRTIALSKKLRCTTCEGQSVYDSNADMAKTVQAYIHTQVMQGKTDRQILSILQRTFGDQILYKPPFDQRTVLLWLAPLIVLLAGLLIIWPFIRKRK